MYDSHCTQLQNVFDACNRAIDVLQPPSQLLARSS